MVYKHVVQHWQGREVAWNEVNVKVNKSRKKTDDAFRKVRSE